MRCKHTKKIQFGKNLNSIGTLVKNKRHYQRGYNLNNFHSRGFYTVKRQRGRGIGSAFLGLARFLIPLIQGGYKAIKSEALSAGSDILRDFKDKHLEEIVKNRSKQAIQNLKEKATTKIDSMMKGEGIRKRKKLHKKNKKKTIKRRRTMKNSHITRVTKLKKTQKKSRKRKPRQKKLDIQKIFG